ncbi:MAG: HAMP domain-containing histidine kinase [Rhodocyclaceae bacterium]|nr:HAMP domain-containing histidine kinase [Rhodocyclaceae bacterium]
MNPPARPAGSLRRKIVLGYAAVAAFVIGLSVFSLIEMRLLETQIVAGERIGEFFGATLEIRRFEKNYFLYRQAADLDEHRAWVAQARRLLDEHAEPFAAFATPERIDSLRALLDRYGTLMAEHARDGENPLREADIRQAGKEILAVAEGWARAERSLLREQLARHRHWLMGSIVATLLFVGLAGQLLARRVARPLKQMERNMAAVAAGRLAKLEMDGGDREIVSLTAAFNRVLHELEQRQGQLLRAEKLAALGTLLSGVAHEINNPLSNISTSCEILKEEIGAGGTAFQRELLEQIDAETWRARRIVRSLLDYARERDFRRENLTLAPLVEECLRLAKARIPDRVEVALAIPAELTLAGDKQRLQQALINLIGNAVDAMAGAGHLSIAARRVAAPCPADALVFGQCAGDGSAVEIEVSDDGCGIPAEVLPRICDPFFTTKDVGQGSGLGLFIVFEIVAEHGGCVAVKSAPGQGTTFLLRFPDKEPQ